MNAGEKQPFTPVHLTELTMSPGNIKVGLWICTEHQGYKPFARLFKRSKHLLPRILRWGSFNDVAYIGWSFTPFNHPTDRLFVKCRYRANVSQHISSSPFSFLWRCAK